MKTRNILLTMLTAVLVLISYSVVAEKPDPVNNPPLQVREANVDDDGWIKVHETGVADVIVTEEIDANITGGSIDATITGGQVDANVTNTVQVAGAVTVEAGSTVTVDNFPGQQEVFVNAGEFSSVTRVYFDRWIVQPSETRGPHYFDGGPIHATTIFIADSDHETHVEFSSALAPGIPVLQYTDYDALIPIITESFAYPIPLESVKVQCKNESQTCIVRISVFGF